MKGSVADASARPSDRLQNGLLEGPGERSVVVRRAGGTPLFFVGYHVPAGPDPDYRRSSCWCR